MPNVVRWTLAALAVLVALGPPVAYFRYQYVQAKRLREVSPGRFYRSGQMTATGFRKTIDKYGIKLVINLQHEEPDPLLADHWLGRGTIRESALCKELNVKYALLEPDVLPPNNRLDVPPPVVDQLLELLDDPANYPVLLHCKAGLHRTGRLTAIYRMEYEGWTHGEALRELRANGYGYAIASEADDFIIQFVQNYTPRALRTVPVAPFPRPAVRPSPAGPGGDRP